MGLTLTLLDAPPDVERVKRFDGFGGTVGRGRENDWVLPDPDRVLSKLHCTVDFQGGAYMLTDTSTNGVFVNESAAPLGRGNSVVLRDGDRLRLGTFQIAVGLEAVDAPPPDVLEGFEPDPFGLYDDDGEPARPSFAGGEPGSGAHRIGDAAPDDRWALQPDDLAAAPFGRPAERDEWSVAAPADHLPSEHDAYTPPQAIAGPDDGAADLDRYLDFDPEELLRPEPPAPAAASPPTPTPPTPTPPARAGVAAAEAGAVYDALLRGLGLDREALAGRAPEEVAESVGAAYRRLIEGVRELLAARAVVKNEMRVERTVIGAIDNNPLKFSVSAEAALRQLLGPPTPGYLPAARAIDEALLDIRAHQLAIMAGLQQALASLLARFDPERLTRRLEQGSVLQNLMPAARRARYWNLYETFYKEIAREAEDDFHRLFGKDFGHAYEDQIRRLGRGDARPDEGGRGREGEGSNERRG